MKKELSGKSWSSGYQRWRKYFFIVTYVYIIAHLLAWYVFHLPIWGKTAMVGFLSLSIGHINASAVMVAAILISIFFYGRFFCGWLCHLRGIIEFSDWILQKYKIKTFLKLREKNILLNTRYRWTIRILIVAILFLPVWGYLMQGNLHFDLNTTALAPLSDLPGNAGKLFIERSPINMNIHWTVGGLLISLSFILLIFTSISTLMNMAFGQGAFCRVLCPYSVLFMPLMNLNPWQKKITQKKECSGCRKCSDNCPQGIDVSREIYHYKGKVINRECIKCYRCIDSCSTNVLQDSGTKAFISTTPKKEYIKQPWKFDHKHLQITNTLPVIIDLLSVVVAIVGGSLASSFGGFWFYVGLIWSFIIFRKLAHMSMNFIKKS